MSVFGGLGSPGAVIAGSLVITVYFLFNKRFVSLITYMSAIVGGGILVFIFRRAIYGVSSDSGVCFFDRGRMEPARQQRHDLDHILRNDHILRDPFCTVMETWCLYRTAGGLCCDINRDGLSNSLSRLFFAYAHRQGQPRLLLRAGSNFFVRGIVRTGLFRTAA